MQIKYILVNHEENYFQAILWHICERHHQRLNQSCQLDGCACLFSHREWISGRISDNAGHEASSRFFQRSSTFRLYSHQCLRTHDTLHKYTVQNVINMFTKSFRNCLHSVPISRQNSFKHFSLSNKLKSAIFKIKYFTITQPKIDYLTHTCWGWQREGLLRSPPSIIKQNVCERRELTCSKPCNLRGVPGSAG